MPIDVSKLAVLPPSMGSKGCLASDQAAGVRDALNGDKSVRVDLQRFHLNFPCKDGKYLVIYWSVTDGVWRLAWEPHSSLDSLDRFLVLTK